MVEQGSELHHRPEWQVPAQVVQVAAKPTPEKMFVCLGSIRLISGVALRKAYEKSTSWTGNLATIHDKHLVYMNALAREGKIWEAGPSADFTEVLSIFVADNIGEAKALMHKDPFYQNGIYCDDELWFEYNIHAPFSKCSPAERPIMEKMLKNAGILPAYPEGIEPEVIEVVVDNPTPPHIYMVLCKSDPYLAEKLKLARTTGIEQPEITGTSIYHLWYVMGGISLRGGIWESGSSTDHTNHMSCYSCDSLETATRWFLNDPYVKAGYHKAETAHWFEWMIHFPFDKASPAHKEALQIFLRNSGVIV